MRSAAPRGTNDLLLIRRLALQAAASKAEKEKRVLMERAESSVFFPQGRSLQSAEHRVSL